MLSNNIKKYILNEKDKNPMNHIITLYQEEKNYIDKYYMNTDVFGENILFEEISAEHRFSDSYLELSYKDSDDVGKIETATFLKQPLTYFQKHKNEFLYVESKWFSLMDVDAISIEADDVFGTYDVMLGLKLQKKFKVAIQTYLQNNLKGNDAKFDLMFSQNDGLWDLNFALNSIEGFYEEMTMEEAYHLIYAFLFKLVESVEEGHTQVDNR